VSTTTVAIMHAAIMQSIVILNLFLQVASQSLSFGFADGYPVCLPSTVSRTIFDPNTYDVFTDKLSMTTSLNNGVLYTISFTNIGDFGFTFFPIFKPGSQVYIVQSNNTAHSVMQQAFIAKDSPQHDCLLQFDEPSTPTESNSPGSVSFGQQNGFQLSQCESTTWSWSGGTSPYSLAVSSTTTPMPSISLLITNITSLTVNLTLPLGADSYQMVLTDRSMDTETINFVIQSGSANCLIEDVAEEQTSHPGEFGSFGIDSHKRTILISVLTILLGLLLVAAGIFVFRRVQKKRRALKRKEFDDRTFLRLEQIKPKNPDTKS